MTLLVVSKIEYFVLVVINIIFFLQTIKTICHPKLLRKFLTFL